MSKGPAPFDQGLFLMHLQKGKEYFDQDQPEKAREELEAAYHLRPQDEKVLNMLGMTYYKLEMLQEAEDMYVTLAANNPDIYALQSNLGLIQLKMNRLQQARDSLNRALELQPSNTKAHFYMGLLYEKQELWEDALYHFEQANAEKMVAKMQAKFDEQRSKPELVMPFEVVEVLEPETGSVPEQDLRSFIQEEIQSQPEKSDDAENTGRMRAPDLAEAMLQIHSEEMLSSPEPGYQPYEEAQKEEIQDTVNLQPPAELSENEEAQAPPEEELVNEENAGSMAEQMVDEIHEERPWEKTHPTMFPEQFGTEPETVVHNETSFLISPSIDDPLLLSDEIAADISTFLAQSRTEENQDEDVFYQDPVLTELTILSMPETGEPQMPDAEESLENRIPTPEEVENEISETEASVVSIAEATPAGTDVNVVEEAVELIIGRPMEDTVEELSDEILSESAALTVSEPPEEEDLEVNFAVHESEEEENQIEEGFLQPSPLTPEIEEEKREQTQDMSYTVEPRIELNTAEEEPSSIGSSVLIPEEIPIQEEIITDTPVQEEVVTETAGQEEAITEIPVQEEVVAETIPEPPLEETASPLIIPEPSAPEPLVAEELAYPANLDQLSRDRLYIQPLIGSDRFLLIDPHLLEIIIAEKLICRIGTISSYTGNLQFTPWDKDQKEQVPLILVSGSGIVFLADRRKEILLISLNNEIIFVESNHLLAAQSSLRMEPQVFQQESTGSSFTIVKVSGRGTLALTCQTKPLTVNVHEELPANIPAQAIIAWSGKLVSEVMDDGELKKILMSPEADQMFLRFRGSGDVVVEQGGLWGDKRIRK